MNILGEPEHEALKVRSHVPQLSTEMCVCLPNLFSQSAVVSVQGADTACCCQPALLLYESKQCVAPYNKRCLRLMASRHFATACPRNACIPQSFHLQGIQKVLTDCLVAHSSWLEADGTLCDNFALVSSCKVEALQPAAVTTLSKVLVTPDDWEYFGHHAAAQCTHEFVDSAHKRMEIWMTTALHPAMTIPCPHPHMQIICKLLQSHVRHILPIVYSLCLLHLHGLILSTPPDVVTVPL